MLHMVGICTLYLKEYLHACVEKLNIEDLCETPGPISVMMKRTGMTLRELLVAFHAVGKHSPKGHINFVITF